MHVQKLVSELNRLYLMPGVLTPERLDAQLRDPHAAPIPLTDAGGHGRALAIPFRSQPGGGDGHWTRLCALANALQSDYGFAPPAVSVSGTDGFDLWLSLDQPVARALRDEFVARLRQAELVDDALDGSNPVLPPCALGGADKWSAFIHPDLGASFADEPWLEMAPPPSGQTALLSGLRSIGTDTFTQALATLRAAQDGVGAPVASAPAAPVTSGGLLLADATLEDIVRHLHAKHIEPTFRHLIP